MWPVFASMAIVLPATLATMGLLALRQGRHGYTEVRRMQRRCALILLASRGLLLNIALDLGRQE